MSTSTAKTTAQAGIPSALGTISSNLPQDSASGESLLHQLHGKLLFVALTFIDAHGVLVDQYQTSGRVESADAANPVVEGGMVQLRQEDGSLFRFPADSKAIQAAGPGEYRVRHSGQMVLNPDFLGHFEVVVRREADVERYRLGGFPAH